MVGNTPNEGGTERVFSFSDSTPLLARPDPSASVVKMGPAVLAEFAKLDGSTFVSPKGVIVRTNTIVTVLDDNEEFKWFKLGWGARHTSGERISRAAPNAFVIIVSETGRISMLGKGGEFGVIEGVNDDDDD